jgi:hypothetical protein
MSMDDYNMAMEQKCHYRGLIIYDGNKPQSRRYTSCEPVENWLLLGEPVMGFIFHFFPIYFSFFSFFSKFRGLFQFQKTTTNFM